MRVGSLFSGIGGFDLGLEQAGMTVAWQSEIDAACNRVLEARWPDVENRGDVRSVGVRVAGRPERPRSRTHFPAAHSEPDDGRIGLLCGGFPCQDLSIAGRRAGLAGERSGLFFEFARIADAVQPGWVALENVPGLLSSNSGRDFAVVLTTLADLGFQDVSWRVVNSLGFGVPQRRRRVFVVGRAGVGAVTREVLLESEGRPWRARKGGEARQGFGVGDRGSVEGDGVARCLTASNTRLDGDTETFLASTLTASAGHHGRSSPRGDGSDHLVAAGRVRRLTPTECERLQGFPDGWTEPAGSDAARYRCLGNAVTVPVARWLGERILDYAEVENAA